MLHFEYNLLHCLFIIYLKSLFVYLYLFIFYIITVYNFFYVNVNCLKLYLSPLTTTIIYTSVRGDEYVECE